MRNAKHLHILGKGPEYHGKFHIDFAEPFLGNMFLIVVDAHSK